MSKVKLGSALLPKFSANHSHYFTEPNAKCLPLTLNLPYSVLGEVNYFACIKVSFTQVAF